MLLLLLLLGFKVTALATALLLSRCHTSLLHFVGQVEVLPGAGYGVCTWVLSMTSGLATLILGIGDFDPHLHFLLHYTSMLDTVLYSLKVELHPNYY
jgi:hypothetical protein